MLLLRLRQLRIIESMVVSQPQKGRLVPLLLLIIKVLVVALLENFVAVGLMILDDLLFEALVPFLLIVENLEDLLLIHEDVSEVHILLY